MLIELRLKLIQPLRSLPILGPLVDEFADWCHHQRFTPRTIETKLFHLRHLARYFNRRGVRRWQDLRRDHFERAWGQLAGGHNSMGGTVWQTQRFLEEVHGLVLVRPKPVTRCDTELERYAVYLHQVQGLAEQTIASRRSCLRGFLRFIGYERSAATLAKLRLQQVEAFIAVQSKSCTRNSLRGVVGCLKAYLRFQHAEGVLPRPFHTLIAPPLVYRCEQLPRVLSWPQVQTLLGTIDCRQPHGLRDYAMLYLIAAYGLRRGEVVALTLDSIDWRNQILRVSQTKTQRHLVLPLTDEAGDILQRYLRKGRPPTEHRALFLRVLAPVGPLGATALYSILNQRIRASGLNLEPMGTHCLRHSFAVRLLRQGVSMKTIGDTLGHQAVSSTAVYLRLAIEDLRDVGLEVPKAASAPVLLEPGWEGRIPQVRSRIGPSRPPARFRSGFGASIQRYLKTKQALGRKYVNEAGTLLHWDAFVFQHQGRAQKVNRKLFQQWASQLGHLSPIRQRNCLRFVRNFMLFHARDHSPCFIPELAAFPKASAPRPPRLISVEEMANVLTTASRLAPSPQDPLLPETVRMALVLLFCCGLRLGELLRLRPTHFDLQQNVLRIHETKFHKSRLVPLSDSVAGELRRYLERRRQTHHFTEPDGTLWPRPHPERSARYHGNGLRRIWRHLCLSVGLRDERGRPPRIHDARHAFAVAALERWYAQEADVQSKLPHLAAFLGHVNPTCTHLYLHLTPKLRKAASHRFHQRFAPLFAEGGKA